MPWLLPHELSVDAQQRVETELSSVHGSETQFQRPSIRIDCPDIFFEDTAFARLALIDLCQGGVSAFNP